MSYYEFSEASVDEVAQIPFSAVLASPQFAVIGGVVVLNGQGSQDPLDAELTYTWSFDTIPIGSLVKTEPFKSISDDTSIVSFSPDIVGVYKVSLVVNNGTFQSIPAIISVDVRAALLPDGRGLVPDGKFIWSYIRDV